MATFDGVNLVITLDSGVTNVDVGADIYTPWKTFLLADPLNRRFPPAFRSIAGDDLTPGLVAAPYYFLRNDLGWRIRPPEEDITINLTDNLLGEDSTLPVAIPTVGGFTALILGIQPVTQGLGPINAKLAIIEQALVGDTVITGTDPFTITIYTDATRTVISSQITVTQDGLDKIRVV